MHPKTIASRFIITQFLFLTIFLCHAQKENTSPDKNQEIFQLTNAAKDTLKKKTNKELFDIITATNDRLKQEAYIDFYLDKGKKEKNLNVVGLAYLLLMNNRYNTEEALVYADSVISLTSIRA